MLTQRRRAIAIILLPPVLVALITIPLLLRQSDEQAPTDNASEAAVDWLRTQQLPDGAFAGFSGSSDVGTTADVVLAFAAAGVNPSTVRTAEGMSALDYLLSEAADAAADPGLAAKLVLAFHASGVNPRFAGGVDLTDAVGAGFDDSTGWYGGSFYGHALAVLALHSQGFPVEPEALDSLHAAQTPEGSWGFAGSPDEGSGDSNTTAVVIQALAARDDGDESIQRGLAYLRSLQDPDGAIAYDGSAAPVFQGDANSTALAIQAFVAAGEDPTALPGGDLIDALAKFQNGSGAFQFQPSFPDDSLLATAQAVPAMMLVALPYSPVVLSVTETMR